MHINFILIPFIILLGIFLPENDKGRKVFIIVVLFIFSLESALRSMFLVSDSITYYEMYTRWIPYMTWDEIWSDFMERYFGQGEKEFDIGFYVIQKALSHVTGNYQVFSFLSQLLFYIPMGIFLYKYSTNKIQLVFAFVFFIALLQVSTLGGARQVLARGCWIMTFMLINERKYLKGLLWLLIGMTFHFSILIVLAAVVLGFFRSKDLKFVHLLSLFALPIVLLIPNRIVMFMGIVMGSERYANYGEHEIMGGATTFVTLMILLSVFCFIMLKKNSLQSNIQLRKLYAMLPCLTVIAPLIIADGVMIRLSSYFHMFLMLIVPLAIEEFKDSKTKMYMYVLVIGALAFLTLKGGGLKYYFFWQDYGKGLL